MRVPVDGGELFCTTRGSGPACFVLSGIGTRPYEVQMPAAMADRWRLVFVDLRGSGQSTGHPSGLTFDVLARDLEAVRSALGCDRVAVLGHSLLGMVAVEYGRRFPRHVSHVIAVGTPPFGDLARVAALADRFFDEDASEERKQVLRDALARLPAEASRLQSLLSQTPRRFHDPWFDAAPLFEGAIARPELLGQVMTTLAPPWDVTADVGSLGVPTLVALGRHDYVVPWRLWDGLAERLPHTTVAVFDRSGHQPFVEQPEAFVSVLNAWADRQANCSG